MMKGKTSRCRVNDKKTNDERVDEPAGDAGWWASEMNDNVVLVSFCFGIASLTVEGRWHRITKYGEAQGSEEHPIC